MIFDAPKVTYNMYSCAISGMSREIMKMDDRDSSKCQNWEKRDKIGIRGIDKKIATVSSLPMLKEAKNVKCKGENQ